MKITGLRIENFLAITEAELKLADRGLVLIQGVNDADTSALSNGAGKSTIPDALCWALYGTTARGETGDAVINDTAGKNTRVVVRITDGPLTYEIVRHRKHKTGKNTLAVSSTNGLTTTDLTKGTDKLTQEVVTKIVGASLEVFTGSIYAGQERMPDLPGMTDKQLKMLVEEASGVLILEEAYARARENLRAAKAETDRCHAAVTGAVAQVEDARRRIDETKQDIESWETGRRAQVNALVARVKDDLLPRIKAEQEKLAAIPIDKIKAGIEQIDARIAGVQGENQKLAELERAAANAKARFDMRTQEAGTHERQVEAAQTELDTVKARVGEPCKECGRPLTEHELDDTEARARKRLEEAQAALERHVEVLVEATADLNTAHQALTKHKAGMTDISRISQQRAVLAAKTGDYTAIFTEVERLKGQAKADADAAQRLKAEVNPHAAALERARKALEDREKAANEAEATLQAAAAREALEAAVTEVFGPAGVRARVLDEVTPFLNAQTEKYLAVLSDGNISAVWSTLTKDAKGNLKERFQIDVANVTGAKRFGGLSGGEKRKVRLAGALALQDLVATRASKPIELFMADEIDDALDDAGLERLMTVLEEKARERGSVFVISHNPLKDWVRNTITVHKTAAGAVVREDAA